MDNLFKIINYLGKNVHSKYTMNELSKILKIPYASFYRTIQTMNNLVIIENIGKAKVISINSKNSIVKSYLAISSEEEKKEYLKKYPIIKIISKEIGTNDIVILFGSYAKKTERENSDIDLMIINENGKKSIFFSKYEMLFKKEINPIFFSKDEFELMLKEQDENVGKQALKYHIVLNNPQGFWECVFNGI